MELPKGKTAVVWPRPMTLFDGLVERSSQAKTAPHHTWKRSEYKDKNKTIWEIDK